MQNSSPLSSQNAMLWFSCPLRPSLKMSAFRCGFLAAGGFAQELSLFKFKEPLPAYHAQPGALNLKFLALKFSCRKAQEEQPQTDMKFLKSEFLLARAAAIAIELSRFKILPSRAALPKFSTLCSFAKRREPCGADKFFMAPCLLSPLEICRAISPSSIVCVSKTTAAARFARPLRKCRCTFA